MKTLKTLAFASLVAFSTLAFTACDNKKAEGTEGADTTIITPATDDLLQDETDNAEENMMQADTSMMNQADSTGR